MCRRRSHNSAGKWLDFKAIALETKVKAVTSIKSE